MTSRKVVVVTTINPPTTAVVAIASMDDWALIVAGDSKTPAGWECGNATYLSLEDQRRSKHRLASVLPVGHYSRKNIGYLEAIASGADVLAETDDDNAPYADFLQGVGLSVTGRQLTGDSWVNVYACFTDRRIWPRGLPLQHVADSYKPAITDGLSTRDCIIQQYLADDDPDVDSIYRLVIAEPVFFDSREPVLLGRAWSPFNSQNTVWFPAAFPLLYLPSLVSFRMTDIWRAFVAQTCLRAAGESIAFLKATVQQFRNPHSLIRDFEDEVPGYLHNEGIMTLLSGLDLPSAKEEFLRAQTTCYEALVRAGYIPEPELALLHAWTEDYQRVTASN